MIRKSALAAACAALLAGCAQAPNLPILSLPGATAPARAEGEVCYEERAALYDAGFSAQATDQIATVGASIVGDIFKTIIGRNAGPFATLLNERFDEAMAGLLASMKEDRTRIASFNAAFEALGDCRVAARDAIRSDLRNRRVNRADADARMKLLRDTNSADTAFARDVGADIAERTTSFETNVATARTKAKTPAQQQEVKAAEAALQTNQQELRTTQSEIAVAQTNSGSFVLPAAGWLAPLVLVAAARRRRARRAAS